MLDKKYFFICLFISLLAFHCKKNTDTPVQQTDQLLVSYGNKHLKFSDIISVLTDEIRDRDSQLVVGYYIEKWIKDQIMLREAGEHLNNLAEIEKLTEDYRNELFLLKYEDQLIHEKLDTAISDDELMSYYNSNKSRYKLEGTIFRFIFIKANQPVADAKNLENIWKNLNEKNFQMLNVYCQNNADICFINPEKWYKWEDVKQYIPSKYLTESGIHTGVVRDFADFNFSYKIKFYEVVQPNEEPPLSFLREQATQAILHKRKLELLEKIKADLYDKELKNKRIIFPNK
jgi:hypothetical protein